jgi:hypothetical protein
MPNPAMGEHRRWECPATQTPICARIQPLADGAWRAWAAAYHPQRQGLRAEHWHWTVSEKETAQRRAEEGVQALAEWLSLIWSDLEALALVDDREEA